MYYFLAITLEDDVVNGSFWPSYILCKARTTSENRSNWRIVRQVGGVPLSSLLRVLVTETIGHDDMISFMSSYQAMEKGKHYHPYGHLCWYECNRYGDPTGVVHIIKRVPEYVWIYDFGNKGYQKLKKDREKKKTLQEVLSAEPRTTPLNTSGVKPKLHQTSHRQDLENERKRRK